MRCPRHDVAAGPDGRCVLCRRQVTEAEDKVRAQNFDRSSRRVARFVVAVAAGIATFVLLLVLFDEDDSRKPALVETLGKDAQAGK